MTKEEANFMIVHKDDCIGNVYDDDSIQPYEIVMADLNYFAAAPIYIEDGIYKTNLDSAIIRNNDKRKTNLHELGFIKLD